MNASLALALALPLCAARAGTQDVSGPAPTEHAGRAAWAWGGGRVDVGSCELRGPCAGVEFTLPDGSRTRLGDRLGRGERREARAPFVRAENGLPRATSSQATFLGWTSGTESAAGAGDAWRRISPGLAARALIAAPAPDERAGRRTALAAWWLAAAVFALVLRVRAQAARALAVGIVGAALLSALLRAPAPPPPARAWIDADARGALRVRAARGELAFEIADLSRRALVTRPGDAVLDLRPDTTAPARSRWLLGASGADLFEVGPSALTLPARASSNVFGALERVWSRDAQGQWLEHGPWAWGASMPAARGAGDPPGWLAADLPQGVAVLLAEVRGALPPEPGEFAEGAGAQTSEPAERTSGGSSWLRVSDF